MNSIVNLLTRGLVPQSSIKCDGCGRINDSVYKFNSGGEKQFKEWGWVIEDEKTCPECVERGLQSNRYIESQPNKEIVMKIKIIDFGFRAPFWNRFFTGAVYGILTVCLIEFVLFIW